jgi:hypothetical protein
MTSVGVLSEFQKRETFKRYLFHTLKFFVEMYFFFCERILTWHCGSYGTYRAMYSLYERRLVSLIYCRCVYKNECNNTPWKHARSCCMYSDTVTLNNTLLGWLADTDWEGERSCCVASRQGRGAVTCGSSEVEWLDGTHWQSHLKSWY